MADMNIPLSVSFSSSSSSSSSSPVCLLVDPKSTFEGTRSHLSVFVNAALVKSV